MHEDGATSKPSIDYATVDAVLATLVIRQSRGRHHQLRHQVDLARQDQTEGVQHAVPGHTPRNDTPCPGCHRIRRQSDIRGGRDQHDLGQGKLSPKYSNTANTIHDRKPVTKRRHLYSVAIRDHLFTGSRARRGQAE